MLQIEDGFLWTYLFLLLSYLSPLNSNYSLYKSKSLSELMLAKLKMPYFTINNAQNRVMFNLSKFSHYKSIKELENLFINEKIRLTNFLFDYNKSMSISDATLLKRNGKKYMLLKSSRITSLRAMRYYRTC